MKKANAFAVLVVVLVVAVCASVFLFKSNAIQGNFVTFPWQCACRGLCVDESNIPAASQQVVAVIQRDNFDDSQIACWQGLALQCNAELKSVEIVSCEQFQ